MLRRISSIVYDSLLKSIYHNELARAFRIHSHLTVRERITLYRLALGKQTILEIGSYIGASACCFGAAVKKSGFGKVFCIDTWKNDAMSEGSRDTYDEFLKNIEPYKHFIIPVRGWSTEVVDDVAMRTNHLDLLFIDGDHSYHGVKADWDAYNKFLRPGSIIVLHDWGWAEGVKRVINEDVKAVVSKSRNLPNMWWGIIKKA